MTIQRNGHPSAPSTSGARQTVAAGFAALLFFMLLFPLAHLSVEGSMDSRLLIQMVSTDGNLNVFALLLLLVPVVGIAIEMLAPRAWRWAGAVTAVAGIVLIPLALLTMGRIFRGEPGGVVSVSPGLATYALAVGYIAVAVATGMAAVQARRNHVG